MSELYQRIETLAEAKKISVTTLCKEADVSRASLTDLKMGRKQSLSAKTLSKLAAYLEVSVGYLLGNEEAPTEDRGRPVSVEEIKFALFGGDGEITDEMYREVCSFAAYVKRREEEKKRKE